MDYEGFLQLVKERRSIRSFKTDPIPDDFVNKIIEAARWSPSGANSQPWEFIIIKDKEIKEKILQFHGENAAQAHRLEQAREKDLAYPGLLKPADRPTFASAPVWIILCGDTRTKEAYPNEALLYRGEANFMSSLANAFLCMHFAAASLGLGSQWASTIASPYTQALIKNLLEIPKDLRIYDMMAVGYPLHKPGSKMVREMSSMVHYAPL